MSQLSPRVFTQARPENRRNRGRAVVSAVLALGFGQRAFWGLLALCALPLVLAGCVSLVPGADLGGTTGGGKADDRETALVNNWPEIVFEGIKDKYIDQNDIKEIKVLFLNPPRPSRVRYRYWTEKRFEGRAGLALIRARKAGLFSGLGGSWYELYVLDEEGKLAFLTEKLEWSDATEPLFALEEVDRTKTSSTRLVRALGLDPAASKVVTRFISKKFEELPPGYSGINAESDSLGF